MAAPAGPYPLPSNPGGFNNYHAGSLAHSRQLARARKLAQLNPEEQREGLHGLDGSHAVGAAEDVVLNAVRHLPKDPALSLRYALPGAILGGAAVPHGATVSVRLLDEQAAHAILASQPDPRVAAHVAGLVQMGLCYEYTDPTTNVRWDVFFGASETYL